MQSDRSPRAIPSEGEWYPGESLPRWALACYWRWDGVPLWRDAALLADKTCEYSYGLEQVERFVRALTRRLGVDPGLVVPSYEDVVYYLWREGTLPANVDPMKYDLKDSEERRVRMSEVQMLLLRALLARFWKTPYRYELARWGTELHDRFTLPHYVWQDFREVICELQKTGYTFQLEWFTPFFEFGFPQYGTIQAHDIRLELRMAIEPWHVLGEETVTRRTARYVDSSVERVQVKVNGLTDTRHIITCNKRCVPLHPTGTRGEFVAGVRYKAWNPPSALHPKLAPHSPMVFDIVDVWMGRSLGGCTDHVAHPVGRHHETILVNASEAEARCLVRFWSYGHTPGPVQPPSEEPNREFPHILDLRRPYEC